MSCVCRPRSLHSAQVLSAEVTTGLFAVEVTAHSVRRPRSLPSCSWSRSLHKLATKMLPRFRGVPLVLGAALGFRTHCVAARRASSLLSVWFGESVGPQVSPGAVWKRNEVYSHGHLSSSNGLDPKQWIAACAKSKFALKRYLLGSATR